MRLLLAIVLAAILCACERVDVRAEPPVEEACATVAGLDIAVRLEQSHPTQAEHRKSVQIRAGQQQVAAFSMIDPGGFATVYVLDDGPRLVVVDGLANGVVIRKADRHVADVVPQDLPKGWPAGAAGHFAYGGDPERYRWIPGAPAP